MPAHYMIRAMEQCEEDFQVFFKNSVVAVGWSNVNFTESSSPETLVNAVVSKYYSDGQTAPQVVGKKKNEIRRFKHLQCGDHIVVPYWSSIRLATAKGQELFSAEDGQTRDLGNQHAVDYLLDKNVDFLTVPRDQLSEGLQRRLRVRGSTILDLKEFAQEIKNLFKGVSYTSTIARKRHDQEREFKRRLISLLRDGESALRAGGIGLEALVAELLKADGYTTATQSKRRFHEFADADIEATRDDYVASVRLLVQVKHHYGATGTWGAKQLSHILETEPDLFHEYRLVLVTSAEATHELSDLCRANDIVLIDGERLAEWITDSLPKLRPETRHSLRISDIPQIIEDIS